MIITINWLNCYFETTILRRIEIGLCLTNALFCILAMINHVVVLGFYHLRYLYQIGLFLELRSEQMKFDFCSSYLLIRCRIYFLTRIPEIQFVLYFNVLTCICLNNRISFAVNVFPGLEKSHFHPLVIIGFSLGGPHC